MPLVSANDAYPVISDFISELKRRRVIRVAIVYLIVGWGMVQFADAVFEPLQLPGWSVTLVIFLVFLGFPIAVLLAWAFDITDHGVERTRRAGTNTNATEQPAIAAAPAAEVHPNSVAALPFMNLSGDPSQEYFSDGVTEELINTLSRLRVVRVAARTSSFAFKNTQLDAREIGRKLGVSSLIEGSVRLMENRLRLSVQLVSTSDGTAIWSESYERDMHDVFAVQREIAQDIANRLGATPGMPVSAPSPAETHDPEAFKLYLKGRFFWNRRTPDDLRRAIEHFDRALELDPRFALAYAGLADAYAILLDYGLLSTRDGLDRARRAAEEALRLDASLGEAYTSLALARQLDWQWRAAEESFIKAIERRPDYPVARQRYSLFLAWTGRPDQALAQIHEAQRIDPLSAVISATAGWVSYYARRYDRAQEQLARALEMDPHLPTARVVLGLVALQQGRTADAVTEHEHALEASRGSAPMRALLAVSLARAGDADAARTQLRALQRESATGFVSPYYIALAHFGLGETEAALDHLEQARDERAAQVIYLRAEPLLDPLRNEPRFQRVLEETGLCKYEFEVEVGSRD
jgi:TolB-like protein/Tfp pilus assembly protein PilF